ncbi:fatty acid desaturase, partial [Arthrospira platensis SPKY1]|nr:fatty acid desaturase [Arthrospira platensis SPKY1]
KLRVNEYFETRQRSRFADWRMVLKTIAMLGLYFVPYFLIVTSVITNYWLVFATWMVMGLGVAGIGMSVMHDANHGAYSRHAWVNALFGGLLNLLGANVLNWKIQHNMLHHTY